MILFPAIDLKDGVVRPPRQRRDGQATVYNENPGEQARAFMEMGFSWVHVVDLDGAVAGKTRERGGGRRHPLVRRRQGEGAARRRHPRPRRRSTTGWRRALRASSSGPPRCAIPISCARRRAPIPGQIAVGIDARGGKVAIEGWIETSEHAGGRSRKALRGRRRRGDHLHRHRPRRRADRRQLGGDDRARRRRVDPGDRLGRPRLDGRHRAADAARRGEARRRHHRPRAL